MGRPEKFWLRTGELLTGEWLFCSRGRRATTPAIATLGIATAMATSLGYEGHMKWAEAVP